MVVPTIKQPNPLLDRRKDAQRGGYMQIGDLVTWKVDTINNKAPLEYGVIIGYFKGKTSYKSKGCVWVKFANGRHSHRAKTLCVIQQLVALKDIENKSDYF